MSLLADAVDMGYTFFDTAEVYGALSEVSSSNIILWRYF